MEEIQVGWRSQGAFAIAGIEGKGGVMRGNKGGRRRHSDQVQLEILPFRRQGNEIARGQIGCGIPVATAIFDLCRRMTAWHCGLSGPTQTRRGHADER